MIACKGEAPPPAPRVTPKVAPPVAAVAPKVDRSHSLVTLVCPEGEGPGFFSTPDRVVARARFTCERPRVRLHDGRTLLAVMKSSQRDLDVAELEVAGGEGEPIPIADSTKLAETDDVSVPGGPAGTVRDIVRVRLGVPHYEVAFDRLPQPGAVVVDAQGRAVGLVSDGTLLPIEALGPAPGWAVLEQRMKGAVAQEVATLRRALQKPGLAAALVDGSGKLHAVLLSRTPEPEVKLGLAGCAQTVKVAWEPFRVNAWYDPATRELFHYLEAHDLDVGLSMSTVLVPCSGAELSLDAADPLLHQVSVGKTAQAMVVTSAAPVPLKVAPAPAQGTPGLDEKMWRGRFSALHAELERFEHELRDKQRFIEDADRAARRSRRAAMVLTPDERERYDQYKKDLENAEAERGVFARRLDDLEREASNQSVPREWRR